MNCKFLRTKFSWFLIAILLQDGNFFPDEWQGMIFFSATDVRALYLSDWWKRNTNLGIMKPLNN